MEHKLVELARSLMDQPERFPFLKRQIHQGGIGQDRSGMICSGEQTVAFHLLQPVHEGFIREVIQELDGSVGVNLELSHEGLWTAPADDGVCKGTGRAILVRSSGFGEHARRVCRHPPESGKERPP